MLSLLCTLLLAAPPEHNIVFRETDRFAGWPANHGIWNWGDKILVGFLLGHHQEKEGHTINNEKPQTMRFARSLDGGQTWKIETPSYLDSEGKDRKPSELKEPIDFSHPDFVMQIRMAKEKPTRSFFHYSQDRGHTWKGPYWLPLFDRPGILARTDYQVNGKHELTAYLTSSKADGNEGWPFVARTTDGGLTWKMQSWIGTEPEKGGYAIMPSAVRLSEQELLVWIRCRSKTETERKFWIEPYRSIDNGITWALEKQHSIDNAGNPAHMIKLNDGRLVVTYGYRRQPYGIRAKQSSDGGKTWSAEIILRADGHNWDLGYPRTVQRADGKLVTVYYFNDAGQKERYIAATIWEPIR
jgi:hypothetical protein